MINKKQYVTILIVFLAAGCVSSSRQIKNSQKNDSSPKKETRKEIESAVVAVTEAIKQENVRAKYCPVCGKHFSGHLEKCPACGVLLKEVE